LIVGTPSGEKITVYGKYASSRDYDTVSFEIAGSSTQSTASEELIKTLLSGCKIWEVALTGEVVDRHCSKCVESRSIME
jgi:hypothetical protein